MHPLLRYTLDMFEAPSGPLAKAPVARKQRPSPDAPSKPFLPVAPVKQAQAFAHPRANREVLLADALVAYAFERVKRRSIGFVVGPDGLVVRAPKWTSIFEVEAALQEKARWIVRKLGETRERQARRDEAQIAWRDGAEFPFLGERLRVVLDKDDSGLATDSMHSLRLALPTSASTQQIRDAVQDWLMRQAQLNFRQRLDHFAPLLQVQWRRLSLSNATTRWGSARSDGSIRLNWRLIHFRQTVVDYVVAHELSHLRVMDHSPRFWETVGTVVPDYAALRGQLKDDSIPRWHK